MRGSPSTARDIPRGMQACTMRRGALQRDSNGNGTRETRSRRRQKARSSSPSGWREARATRQKKPPLIRKTRVVHPIGYRLDKAYDSEEIRRVVREEVRAACMIPLRKRAKSGTYRRAMLEKFDDELYHRRNLVETMFSLEKRVFRDVNRRRSIGFGTRRASCVTCVIIFTSM
ncbi:MAG: hypothetical protein WCE81_07010 [Halobacteriota archaeon]